MKKLLSIIWPVGLIVFVWFLFSYPYFLQHKVPFPSSYGVNFFPPWNAYHIYDGPVKNNAMPDVVDQIYPWRELTIESWKQGQVPLWNPYSFSGTPHLANYQSAALSPLNFLFLLFSFVDAWSILILLQPLLAGLFTFMYSRSIKISKSGSVIASVGFMFCGFITTWMDYGTLGYAILFLPLALFAIEKFITTKKNAFLLLLGCTIPLSFFSGHFQMSLYFFLFIIAYVCYQGIVKKSVSLIIFLSLAVLFGLLLAMPQILPSLELYNQSLRSGLFQQIEAIPLGYLPTFLAPDILGNPVTRNDWFGHYAEWNGYIGLLPLMLGFYGVFRKKNVFTMSLFILSILILCLAFATPMLQFVIALHIPVLSTSAASRIIVLFSFIFVILSGFGFDGIVTDLQDKKYKVFFAWLSVFTVIFIFLWAMVSLKLFLPIDKISIAKQNLKLPTISFFIIAVICMIAVFYSKIHVLRKYKFFTERKIVIPVFISSIFIVLTMFDMLRFATKWQPFDPKEFVFPQVAVTNHFPPKQPYERVFGDDGGQLSVKYGYSSIEGYDPLYSKRYGEFIASLDGKIRQPERSVVVLPKNARYAPRALQLLNVGYILQKNSDNGQPWGFPFDNYPITQFTPIYNDGVYQVFKNNTLLPHAFFAQNYSVQTKPQNILNVLFADDTHLNSTVVLEEDPHISQGGVSGTADITNYTNNSLSIRSHSNKDAVLFLSEVYYPGWKAFVDGKETTIYRADYTFRAIVVPSGFHTVVFRYEPMSFEIGCWLFVSGLIGLLVISFIPKRKMLQ